MFASANAALAKSKEVVVSNISYPRVFVYQDIVYEDNLNPRYQLKMDVFVPAINKKMPVLVFIPGGGFIRSDKTENLQQRLKIAEQGYVVASIEYRTVPDAIYQDAVSDVKSAIRYLRANAQQFSIKEDKIAVMGVSAGGYLAAMVGVTNGIQAFDKGKNLDFKSDVQGVIDIYGPTDLSLIPDGVPEFLRKKIRDHIDLVTFSQQTFVKGCAFNGRIKDPTAEIKANPLSYINKKGNIPPFLLMHGDKDAFVSPNQTQVLYDKLQENGCDVTRYILRGSKHNDVSWYQQDVIDIYVDFLNKNLK